MKITYSAGISPGQQNVFIESFPDEERDKISFKEDVSATDPSTIGYIIIGLTFISGTIFSGFLKEIGKDTYNWIKSKVAIKNTQEVKPIYVHYEVIVGNTTFVDNSKFDIEIRHDLIMAAIQKTLTKMSEKQLKEKNIVSLKYNMSAKSYVLAEIYPVQEAIEFKMNDEGKLVQVTNPIKTYSLVGDTD